MGGGLLYLLELRMKCFCLSEFADERGEGER